MACMAEAMDWAEKWEKAGEYSSLRTEISAAAVIGPEASALVMTSRKGCRNTSGSEVSSARSQEQSVGGVRAEIRDAAPCKTRSRQQTVSLYRDHGCHVQLMICGR